MTRRTLVALATAALAAAGFAVPAGAAVTGQLRTLYVPATWGPVPFGPAELEAVAAETDAFFRVSSAGRFAMPGAVTGPVALPRAVFDSCDATALRNEAPASLFAGFERVVFVTPIVPACPFFGEANPTEVLLNGRLFRPLAAHELGHTLGLGHASRWACAAARCSVDEYGNGFSVMGGGSGDLNAFEKAALGWLGRVVRPRGDARHELGPIEGPTGLPQALVVRTAASEFWFESRGTETPSFMGPTVQPPGVAVVAGPMPGAEASPYPRENLLLPNPIGGARYAYVGGESFVQRGVFSVTIERHAAASAALQFQWLDRVAPARPRLRVRSTRRGRVRLAWTPARERGSGVETYTVVVDGRPVRRVRVEIPLTSWEATLRVRRGRHRVGVFATDRAGIRGRVSSVRLRVR
jgi:hypothetical protein